MLPNHKTHIPSVMIVSNPRQGLEICLYETSVAAAVFGHEQTFFCFVCLCCSKHQKEKCPSYFEKN